MDLFVTFIFFRYLEDIAEADEENLSNSDRLSAASRKSGRSSVASGTAGSLPKRKNSFQYEFEPSGCSGEAMATLSHLDPWLLSGMEILGTIPTTSAASSHLSIPNSGEDHALSILSKDDGGRDRSDSFSINSDRLDSLSLPATDQLDDESIPTDEDLEKAMEARVVGSGSWRQKYPPLWEDVFA